MLRFVQLTVSSYCVCGTGRHIIMSNGLHYKIITDLMMSAKSEGIAESFASIEMGGVRKASNSFGYGDSKINAL